MTTRLTAIDPGGWAPYLEPGESLLWSGAPATGIRFSKADWLVIPFALVWTGAMATWVVEMLVEGDLLMLAIAGVPFMGLGLFLLVGRFYWDAHKRAHTRYALTDRRAILATTFRGRKMKSVPITRHSRIEFRPGPEPSIMLDRKIHRAGPVSRANSSDVIETSFEYVPDGEQVHRLILALQNGATVAEPA